MSSQSRSASSGKKFCKVCKDSGKPEAEYTSHFVRETHDIRSKVVCPTLLANECRYCGHLGHTIQFCKIRQESFRKSVFKPFGASKLATPVQSPKVESNRFANLRDPDEECACVAKKDLLDLSYPLLPHLAARVVEPPRQHLNFVAAISAKTSQSVAINLPAVDNEWTVRTNGKNKFVDISSYVSPPVLNPKIIPVTDKRHALNWADSDTEEEDDDGYFDGFISGDEYDEYDEYDEGDEGDVDVRISGVYEGMDSLRLVSTADCDN